MSSPPSSARPNTSSAELGGEDILHGFLAELGETEYKFRQVVCTRNGMAYILTYASTAANYDRHADEVQETIAQFKFMV